MSKNLEARSHLLTSLGVDDSFELTFGETFAGHLIIPGLVQMGGALEYPYKAQNDVAHNQDEYGCLQRSNGNLGNGDTQQK